MPSFSSSIAQGTVIFGRLLGFRSCCARHRVATFSWLAVANLRSGTLPSFVITKPDVSAEDV